MSVIPEEEEADDQEELAIQCAWQQDYIRSIDCCHLSKKTGLLHEEEY